MVSLLTSGMALGTAYGLLGVGVSLVTLATRTLQLAVGPILVAGVLTRLYLGILGVPAAAAIAAGLLVAASLSAVLEPVVLHALDDSRGRAGRSHGTDAATTVRWLVGFAVAGAAVELAVARWLGTRQLRPDPILAIDVSIAGRQLEAAVVGAVVLGGLLAAGLAVVVTRTGLGRRLRVVGSSPVAAAVSGIPPRLTRAGVLAVGGAAACVAGLLIAPLAFVGVGQGTLFTVRAVAAALLLGVGGPPRALAGGLTLGFAEAAGASLAPEWGGTGAVATVVVVVAAWRGDDLARAWGRPW